MVGRQARSLRNCQEEKKASKSEIRRRNYWSCCDKLWRANERWFTLPFPGFQILVKREERHIIQRERREKKKSSPVYSSSLRISLRAGCGMWIEGLDASLSLAAVPSFVVV